MIKVNRCPFCGATARIVSAGPDHPHVDCPSCGARGPSGADVADAIAKWNLCVPIDVGVKEAEPSDAERL